MTKLPVPISAATTAAAIAYARERVRMVRDEKITFFGLELSWFKKEHSREMVRQMMKDLALSPRGMMDVANLARAGWDLADETLREMIIDYSHRREEMPPTLIAYNMEVVACRSHQPRAGARKKSDNLLRDFAITCVVGDVCGRFGLLPTRQMASKKARLSGCRVVARALAEEGLAISELAVIGVWTRYGRRAFPGGFSSLG
jgi:hypothetical protein